MTTRSKKFGEAGDFFEAFGKTFQILAVFKMPLWRVANEFYRAEGFEDALGFMGCWNRIHPKGYNNQMHEFFWVHIFDLVQNLEEPDHPEFLQRRVDE